jgi:hypothetical protein
LHPEKVCIDIFCSRERDLKIKTETIERTMARINYLEHQGDELLDE